MQCTADNGADEVFRLIVEAMSSAIVLANAQGRIVLVNAGSEKLFGYPRKELIGQPVEMLMPERYRAHPLPRSISTQVSEVRKTDKDGSKMFVLRKDGLEVPVEIGLNAIPATEGPLALSVIRDSTGEKQTEKALIASELRYRRLFETAKDGILILDAETGMVVDVNPFLITLLGFSYEQFQGKTVWDLGFFRDIVANADKFRELREKEYVRYENLPMETVDGRRIEVEFVSNVYLVDGCKVIQCNIRNITERRKAEEAVQQLNATLEQRVIDRTVELEEANKELEAFSYSVSHDLRSPLRAIDGFSRAVQEDFGPQLPQEAQRYLQTIRGGAQQMSALIDDLLAFSRMSRQVVKNQDIITADLVQSALEELRSQEEGREIEVKVGELSPCKGNPILLKQVWVNLLSNAMKYTRKRDHAIIEIGCVEQEGEKMYFVRDNGTGFDMRYADKLFGVFQRLHRAEDYEGTGIGLANVQRIIHRHGGRVWADAVVDQGATFYFTLEEKPNHE